MIKPLTSLRFIFALMVFLHHLGFLRKSDSEFLKWIYNNCFIEGYIGVNFFFVLSGFILAYKYQDLLSRKLKTKTEFIIARIARIYPLHILTLFFSFPLMVSKILIGNKIAHVGILLANVFLVQSFIPSKSVYLSYNRTSWSISDEMFFYLVFPFIIGIIAQAVKSKSKKLYLLGLAFLSIPVLMFFTPASLHHELFYVNPLFRLTDFVLGILLFNLYEKIKPLKDNFNFNLMEWGALLVMALFFIGAPFIPEVYRYSVYYWLPMALLILIFSFQQGVISNFLSNKYLIILGEISFGFYMFHNSLMAYFHILNKRIFHIQSDYLIVTIAFCLTLVVSYISYYWFETPANNYIKKRFKQTL